MNQLNVLSNRVENYGREQKPHCVLLYFSTGQYRQFRRAVLRHGGSGAGRGLVGKEEAIMRIIRGAEA